MVTKALNWPKIIFIDNWRCKHTIICFLYQIFCF
jgi:hypothetical protein